MIHIGMAFYVILISNIFNVFSKMGFFLPLQMDKIKVFQYSDTQVQLKNSLLERAC